MNVYCLTGSESDSDDEWARVMLDGDIEDGPLFDGSPMLDSWNFPPVSLTDGKVYDFVFFELGAVAVGGKAKKAIEEKLGGLVEFLPIKCSGNFEFFVLNVLNVIDCLDSELSEIRYFSDGRVKVIMEHVFRNQALKNVYLFKIPETAGKMIYYTDKFLKLIRENGLTGVEGRHVM